MIGDKSDSFGRLSFVVKGLKDYTVQVTTKGKLGIWYPEGEDFNVVLERLNPYLVRADGSLATKRSVIDSTSTQLQPSRDEPSHQNELKSRLEDCYLQPNSRQETLKILRLIYEQDPECRNLIDKALINSSQRKKETQLIMPTDARYRGVGKKSDRPVVVEPSLKDMISNLDEYLSDRELEALVVSILAL